MCRGISPGVEEFRCGLNRSHFSGCFRLAVNEVTLTLDRFCQFEARTGRWQLESDDNLTDAELNKHFVTAKI